MPFVDIPGRRVHSLPGGAGGEPVVPLGGRDGGDLPGPPASPWTARTGRARPGWMQADALHHHVAALRDPACWSAAVQYYRCALPFHALHDDGAPHLLSEREVGEMWSHPGGLDAHPLSNATVDFVPEDRSTVHRGSALWLHAIGAGRRRSSSAEPGRVQVGDRRAPTGRRAHPFGGRFDRSFPDLRGQPVEAGQFLGEEAAAVEAALVGFLRSRRRPARAEGR